MTEPMRPLRRRMIDDIMIRNMSPLTQKNYVRAVANFSIFHGRSPDKLTLEDVRDYRLHLISRGLKATTINPIMGALRFFYGTTLGRKGVSELIPYARTADTLPAVLAPDEVVRFLKAVPSVKMRTAFITIYAAGKPRGARIAMSCCPSRCSESSAPTGDRPDPSTSCFLAPIRIGHSRRVLCKEPAGRR
jgi:integrase/recombinase XerD